MNIGMIRIAIGSAVLQLGLTADYNYHLAERLVNYASAVYCSGTDKVTNWDCSACKSVPGFSNISQVFGVKHHGRAVIGFDSLLGARIVSIEGTHMRNADIHTVIDDLNMVPSPCYTDVCPGCTCHPGFVETYYEIAADVRRAVSELPAGKLIITGHSLGAAQTTHCSIDLHMAGLTPDHIYTFGEPREGNDAFALFYDGFKFDHWRVTHHRDPITHLAWRGVPFNYRHVLREAYYETAAGGPPTRVCSAVNSEDPLCTDQFNDELTILHPNDHMHYVGLNMWTGWLECIVDVSNSAVYV